MEGETFCSLPPEAGVILRFGSHRIAFKEGCLVAQIGP